MSTIKIPYGRGTVSCELPEVPRMSLPGVRDLSRLSSPRMALVDALTKLTGKTSITRLLADKREVMIIAGDAEHHAAYDTWLGWLLDDINRSGVPDSNITIYIASGDRPAPSAQERVEIYGAEVCRRVQFMEHDCDAIERFTKIGRTEQGTIVAVDNRVLNAEFLIITGGIGFESMFGYTGGLMNILPGVCCRDSIEQHQRHLWNGLKGDIADRVGPGLLTANPLNEDMQEACNMLRPDLCVNVVLNDAREIAWIGAGDPNYVYRIGAGFLDAQRRPQIKSEGEIALVGSGGWSGDGSLLSAHRALRNITPVLASGATVFWFARCELGEGPDSFESWRNLSIAECRRRIPHRPSIAGYTALSLKRIAAEFQIHLVSDLPEDLVREWGLIPHHDLSSSLHLNLPARAENRHWIVSASAHNMLPELPAAAKTKVEVATVSGV